MKIPPIEIKTRSLGFTKIRKEDFLTLENEQLQGADFSGRKLKGLTITGSKLIGCRFENVRSEGGCFGAGREVSEFIECSFDGSRMCMGPGGYARFVGCTFRNTNLRDWFCFCVELIDCTFSGKMHKIIFNGTPREDQQSLVRRQYNEFRGNDFSAMNMEDVSFRTGIDLTQQKLPEGPEYLYLPDAEAAVRRARAEVIEWKDLELRHGAMIWIKSLEEDIQKGQLQLWLRPDDYPAYLRKEMDPVFAIFQREHGGADTSQRDPE